MFATFPCGHEVDDSAPGRCDTCDDEQWIAGQVAKHGPWKCVGCGRDVGEKPARYGTLLTPCPCGADFATRTEDGKVVRRAVLRGKKG